MWNWSACGLPMKKLKKMEVISISIVIDKGLNFSSE
jgi:hypothetical protein